MKILGFGVDRVMPESMKSGIRTAGFLWLTDETGERIEDHQLTHESSHLVILAWIQGYIKGREKAVEIVRSAAERIIDDVEKSIRVDS